MATRAAPRAGRGRRIAERLLLGSVFALIAAVIDRRLRRVFAAQQQR